MTKSTDRKPLTDLAAKIAFARRVLAVLRRLEWDCHRFDPDHDPTDPWETGHLTSADELLQNAAYLVDEDYDEAVELYSQVPECLREGLDAILDEAEGWIDGGQPYPWAAG
jgi:hypothetical protein